MAAAFRLQDLINITGNFVQDPRDSADVGAYSRLVVQVRTPRQPSTTGTVYLQHAAVREDEAFEDVPNASVDLTADNNAILVVLDTARFLRWRGASINDNASLLIDVLGR